jgi:endonuclease/exonuclease/phosphatase family metal-dependent hydrolase
MYGKGEVANSGDMMTLNHAPIPARDASLSSIRLVTWNVDRPRTGSIARNAIVNAKLCEIDADILVLTETHASIRPGSGFDSCATEIHADNQWRYLNNPHTSGENCTTIWSRWPVIRQVPTADPIHGVCVEINTPYGALFVYGSIITWHADKGSDGTAKNWTEHYKAIEWHGRDWSKLRGMRPLCAAGDFNTTLDGTYYGTKNGRDLLRTALIDGDLICITQALPLTIDHICLSPDWANRVEHCFIWQAYTPAGRTISDHYGVGIDIRVPGAPYGNV